MLKSYCRTFDINYRILRLCNVYGDSDKGVSKKKNALQYLISQLQQNKDIDLYNDGMFYRDYMYVDDVCLANDQVYVLQKDQKLVLCKTPLCLENSEYLTKIIKAFSNSGTNYLFNYRIVKSE